LVGNIHHIGKFLGLNQVCDIRQAFIDARADHRVRNLRDHQLVPVRTALSKLYLHPGTQLDASRSRLIDRRKFTLIRNDAAGREIRSL